MAYDLSSFKQKVKDVEEWLSKELSSIRTGRATATLLDGVQVEVYGAKSPINQNANIQIEDPKTIRISPWDKGLIPTIEKAITVADLGVSTSVDDEGLRVIFPDLTTETRERLVKQAHGKVEEAKVSIRNERNKVMGDIKDKQKAGEMSEDDAKREEDSVQKIVDEANKKFDERSKAKEAEVMS